MAQVPSAAIAITYDALESALQWSSSGAPYENKALLCRKTAEIFLKSRNGDFGEERPEDIDDGARYVAMPHKNDLDLGRSLVMSFVEAELPQYVESVQSFFRQRDAYGKLKAFLERERHLERWYEYEANATRAALITWASENGFVVLRSASDAQPFAQAE